MTHSSKTVASIHSIESLGTLDGPGLRSVVFFQGCPLRCKFCHNIDCTLHSGGEQYTVKRLFAHVITNQPYWGRYSSSHDYDPNCVTGGVTLSGGDPTFQPEFLIRFCKELAQKDVHTAIDTALLTTHKTIDKLLPYANLWMVSVKHMDSAKHKSITGVDNHVIFDNIRYLDTKITEEGLSSKIRIRFVVIPGLTNSKAHLRKFGKFIKEIKNLDVLELLPYGSHGKYKWIEIFGKYELEDVPDAEDEDVQKAKRTLEEFEVEMIP